MVADSVGLYTDPDLTYEKGSILEILIWIRQEHPDPQL